MVYKKYITILTMGQIDVTDVNVCLKTPINRNSDEFERLMYLRQRLGYIESLIEAKEHNIIIEEYDAMWNDLNAFFMYYSDKLNNVAIIDDGTYYEFRGLDNGRCNVVNVMKDIHKIIDLLT